MKKQDNKNGMHGAKGVWINPLWVLSSKEIPLTLYKACVDSSHLENILEQKKITLVVFRAGGILNRISIFA